MSADSGSGNRWEPTSATSEDGPATEHLEHDGQGVQREEPEQGRRASRRDGRPARPGWLAGGAAAVAFVLGGAGGFMLAHATTADAQDRTPFGQQGPRNGFGPGGGGQPQGQPPGMSPRQDDRHDDGHDEDPDSDSGE